MRLKATGAVAGKWMLRSFLLAFAVYLPMPGWLADGVNYGSMALFLMSLATLCVFLGFNAGPAWRWLLDGSPQPAPKPVARPRAAQGGFVIAGAEGDPFAALRQAMRASMTSMSEMRYGGPPPVYWRAHKAPDATATVSSGGTTAPAAGTSESWTLSSSTLPAVSSSAAPPTQCYVADTASGAETEKILVTNISGSTATVTRGADGTTPVTHASGFTIAQVLTRASLEGLQGPYFNVMDYGADPEGVDDSRLHPVKY